uniref:Valine--tRNA ligase n=1 Tax=Macrostomum lignano TaxID=282301 RepID=A0A1I8FGV8_9PLAT
MASVPPVFWGRRLAVPRSGGLAILSAWPWHRQPRCSLDKLRQACCRSRLTAPTYGSWCLATEVPGRRKAQSRTGGPFTFGRDPNPGRPSSATDDDVRALLLLSEESVGSMHDFVITNVNLPYLTIALKMRAASLCFLRNIMKNFFAQHGGGILCEESFAVSARKCRRSLAYWSGKNNSAKGTALVGTGSASLANLSQVQRWNGQSSWRSGRVTSATESPAVATARCSLRLCRPQLLKVFTPDLCRSADLSYSGDDKVREILCSDFSLGAATFTARQPTGQRSAFSLLHRPMGSHRLSSTPTRDHSRPWSRAGFSTLTDFQPAAVMPLRLAEREAAASASRRRPDSAAEPDLLLLLAGPGAAHPLLRHLQPGRLDCEWPTESELPEGRRQPLESRNSSDLAGLYSDESKLKLRTGDDAGQLDKEEKPKTGADIEERLLKDAAALPETD